MLQPAECLRLLLEAAQQFGACEARLDDLECDSAAGLILLRLVDGAHAAFTEKAQNPVVSDRRSDGEFRVPGKGRSLSLDCPRWRLRSRR